VSGLGEVRDRIAAACRRAGRAPSEVTLVGVAKRQPDQLVTAAVAAGLRDVAENHAQSLRDRRRVVAGDVRWHFVGTLQRNKAGVVAEHADVFHALDRVEVAAALSARRAEGPALACYLEVNVADEPTKAGVAPGAAGALLDAVADLPGLEVVGLMAMPPLGGDRRHFAALRELGQALELPGLSMGTSADFEVAIEEGATAVRVGEAIFGPRPR
jgi:pyridoxal phosphate enzyme (YggS family)